MSFYIITAITLIALIYCSDYQVLHGFEFLIHEKDSMWYGIGISIIAAYIFHIFQVVIPKLTDEKTAYEVLEEKIKKYLDESYWLLVFCETLCSINRDNKIFTVLSNYAYWAKNDEWSKWIVKLELNILGDSINKPKDKIINSGYYMQLERKKRLALQSMFDNNFVNEFVRYFKDRDGVTYVDLIKNYDAFKENLLKARKQFAIEDTLKLKIFEDTNRIDEFEAKLSNVKLEGRPFMRIEE